MDTLLADVRYGLRLLRKSPVFALITVATLALGIGANTALYSVVDAVVLRALPYHDPDGLAMVWEDSSYVGFPRNTPAPGNYFSWKELNRTFSDMAATRGASANLTTDGPPEYVLGRRVTANFFAVLGVQPLRGRAFTEEEDRTGAPVAMISYGLWQRRYGGRDNVVGSDIVMNGASRTVIGVMPHSFVFRNRDIDFWTPIEFTPDETVQRDSHFLNVVGRLRPDVTMERAAEDMREVAARLAREHTATNARVGAVVVPLKDDLLGVTSLQLIVLLAAAGCVLLIACANVASLLLSRSLSRRNEMAVRAALGATGGRLVRQLVVESMVLAIAGGVAGVVTAPVAIRLLATIVPLTVSAPTASVAEPRLIAFALLVTIVTGLLFGMLPALQTARGSLEQTLRQSGRAAVGGRTIARDVLVVTQIAAALVLLVAAGLLVRTLANLRGVDVGFRPDRLLTLRTALPERKYEDFKDQAGVLRSSRGRRASLPDVVDAAYVSTLPFRSTGNTWGYEVEGRPPAIDQDALFRSGTPDYLRTIGATLVAGRLPEERDTRDAPPVLVINETFARLYWPDESPIGRRVRFGDEDAPWRTIVGVVRDVRERGYKVEMKPAAYVAVHLSGQRLDAGKSRGANAQATRRPSSPPFARSSPASIPNSRWRPCGRWKRSSIMDVVDRTAQTTLLGAFAGLALLLACLGLYGVLSYAVAQRTREIGVRMALGATASGIVRLVVARGLTLTATGLGLGLVIAWFAVRTMRSLLVGVGTGDPMTFARRHRSARRRRPAGVRGAGPPGRPYRSGARPAAGIVEIHSSLGRFRQNVEGARRFAGPRRVRGFVYT